MEFNKINIMKKVRKIASIFLEGLIVIGLLLPMASFADGGMIIPINNHWDPLDQKSQNAFISYKDGFENLIVAVDLDKSDEGAVWIFPVPAEPNKVVIDVLKNIPNLSGEEVIEKAKQNIRDISRTLRMTQIYPIFLERETYHYGPPILELLGKNVSWEEIQMRQDVTVHEHLEKEGMTTEIITAKNSKALYAYLAEKGPELKKGTFPMFDYYIGKDYTFVCSWMTKKVITLGQEKKDEVKEIWEPVPPNKWPVQQKQRGVFITFPTDKIYYPLYPTSIYESKKIPINIRVLDYVKPKLYGTIKPYTKEVKYYWQSYGLGNEFEDFYRGDNIKYTKIEINAPSKYLTEDLWMKRGTPPTVAVADLFAKHPLIDYFLAAILWSAVAGVIAGLIIFKKSRKIKRYALLGLCNVFSIIGLVVGTIFTQTKKIEKEKKEKIKEYQKELKEMGLRITSRDAKRKIFFVLVFSAVFVILTIIRQGILVWIL